MSTITADEYRRAAEALSAGRSKIDRVGVANVARAVLDTSGVAERIARLVESRDKVEGAYELAQREALLHAAQLRELYRELEEALDRACRAEKRAAELANRANVSEGRAAALSARLGHRETDVDNLIEVGRRYSVLALASGVTLAELDDAVRRTSRLTPKALVAYARARCAA